MAGRARARAAAAARCSTSACSPSDNNVTYLLTYIVTIDIFYDRSYLFIEIICSNNGRTKVRCSTKSRFDCLTKLSKHTG